MTASMRHEHRPSTCGQRVAARHLVRSRVPQGGESCNGVQGAKQQESGCRVKRVAHLDEIEGKWVTRLVGKIHVTLQVDIEELKYEIELLVGVNNVQQPT